MSNRAWDEDWIKRRSWNIPAEDLDQLHAYLADTNGLAQPLAVVKFLGLDAAVPMPNDLLVETVDWLNSRQFSAQIPIRARRRYTAITTALNAEGPPA